MNNLSCNPLVRPFATKPLKRSFCMIRAEKLLPLQFEAQLYPTHEAYAHVCTSPTERIARLRLCRFHPCIINPLSCCQNGQTWRGASFRQHGLPFRASTKTSTKHEAETESICEFVFPLEFKETLIAKSYFHKH